MTDASANAKWRAAYALAAALLVSPHGFAQQVDAASNIRFKQKPPVSECTGDACPQTVETNIRLPTSHKVDPTAASSTDEPVSNIRSSPPRTIDPMAGDAVTDPDTPSEASPLHARAEAGDVNAMFALAIASMEGRPGVPRNTTYARTLAQSLAGMGNSKGMLLLGYMMLEGVGGARDIEGARWNLSHASQAGVARADYLLGLLESGLRSPQSDARAESSYLAAAKRGDAMGQNALGVTYQLRGDTDSARLWYDRAAKQGSPAARANLALVSVGKNAKANANDGKSVARLSLPALLKSAQAGNREAQYVLATRFHSGRNAPVDYSAAIKWYKAAAAKGHPGAKRMLDLIYGKSSLNAASATPGAPVSGAIDVLWMQQLVSRIETSTNSDVDAGADAGSNIVQQPLMDENPLMGLEGNLKPARPRK